MQHRLFVILQQILLFYVSAIIISCTGTNEEFKQPNVILIMTDDQGYGEFSCHGNPLVKTPNIDRLANEGISFTDFHVAPMCTPTRGSLMTGMDAFRNGAINVSSGRTLLRPELKTMANVFREAGYTTGIFGKWHLGDNYPYRPEDRGFDETIWFPSSHINSVPDYWNNDYFDDTYIHNGNRKQYEGYCTDIFFREAIKWMEKNTLSGKPFFTYIPINAAHWPHFVPDKYRDPVRRSVQENPEIVGHLPESHREELISFLAMGLNIDENVGTLYDFLEKNSLLKNTIIVFLTDNGSTFGQDYYNAGMRGRKTELWEGGHRVPLFIRTPSKKPGQPDQVGELCYVQDLLPTLASMARIRNIPGNIDGVDLTPLLNGEKDSLDDRMLVINYSRMPMFKVTYTTDNPAIPKKEGALVLWKNWRMLENRELYDVSADPHQDMNIAGRYPEIMAKMQDHLDRWWEGVREKVFEPQRVIIGNDAENPAMLTACEWLEVFVDQQVQIRRGVNKNGVLHVKIDQPGQYRFELRRWPREANVALSDSLPTVRVTDGRYDEGRSLDIHSARLKIGDKEFSKGVNRPDKAVEFTVGLESGENTIQTWFMDRTGETLCGAYYLYVERL